MQTEPVLSVDDASGTSDREHAPESVVVRFGGARYAVPMADVAEVVPVPPVTRVPGMPGWLVGLVNWRGRVLAVVDLRPVIGDPVTPLPSSARLLVLSADDVECGLLVEAVTGLLAPGTGAPVPVPATVTPAAAAVVLGVLDDRGPVSLLDVAAVHRLRESLPSAAPSGA